MTRREIIRSLIFVAIAGGVIASIGVWELVTRHPKDPILIPIVMIFFALLIVGKSCAQAVRELKRRKQK